MLTDKDLNRISDAFEKAIVNAVTTIIDKMDTPNVLSLDGETADSFLMRLEKLENRVSAVSDRVTLKSALTGKR